MSGLDPGTVRRIVLGHLESLRAGGVQWLPKTDPLPVQIHRAANSDATGDQSGSVGDESTSLGLSLEERKQKLQTLATEVARCTRCPELCSSRTQTVFSDGTPNVDICFVGEAPGADEDREGVPFVGAAGRLLTDIITKGLGMKREEVYICNTLKCRPPGNRTPLPNELGNCREYLVAQIELVKPKYIVCLGGSAAKSVLQTTMALGALRGRFHDYQGIPVLVTYHPSFLLPHRQPEKKRDVWEDMKLLLKKMGRPIPGKSNEPA